MNYFKKSNIKDIYSLSPMQEGMLYHSLLDNNPEAYFEQSILSVRGKLDIKCVSESFNKLIDRYDIFRTVFVYKKTEKPVQIVLKEWKTDIHFEDITSLPQIDKETFITSFKTKDRARGFDLTKDMPIRIAVIKTDDTSFKLVWSFHHIIMDGWCLGLIAKEFFLIYDAERERRNINLEKVHPYSDYIKWLEDKDKNEALLYWENYLKDFEQQATLPKLTPIKANKGYRQEEICFKIDAYLKERLDNVALQNNVTLNTVIQTIWGLVLQRYNNTSDIVFGAVVSGRSQEIEGIENMVGLFINTIPVRISREKNETFRCLLAKTQQSALESEQYSYCPLAEIQSKTTLKQALLDHIMIFENYPLEEAINSNNSRNLGFTVENYEIFEQTNYDFNIWVIPGKEIVVKLCYNALIYERELLEKIEGHFKSVIHAITSNLDITAEKLDILTESEKRQLLISFNDTEIEFFRGETIHGLFEKQVEKTPEQVALIFDNSKLTYRELNEKSNQVARKLREMGVKPDTVVGIMTMRSLEMIIGLLGIMKAGGGYLPIDPELPLQRIEYMLADSNAAILLTQQHLNIDIQFQGEFVYLDDCSIYKREKSTLERVTNPEHLAYVIYTSGSTGKPKGVMIEHQSVINFIESITNQIDLKHHRVVLALTTISFDIFVLETLLPLTQGLGVAIANEKQQKDPRLLMDFVIRNQVDVLQLTPSRLKMLLNDNHTVSSLKNIKKILVGGEAFPGSLLKELKSVIPARIYNMYGPTETTVWSAIKELTDTEEITLGSPINNTRIYIVDKNNNLQPVGVPGELCIAGAGLARGYINNLDLTSKKFIADPFKSGEKMYKTGDLAKRLPNGEIEFIGRLDYQIKIRGFRIELGEIESQLLHFESLKEAVVVAKQDESGDNYLCAYYVASKELDPIELKEYLLAELPDYMVPAYLIQLDKFPLSPNGKIDIKQLKEIQIQSLEVNNLEAPRNQIEETLAQIWSSVLRTNRIGTNKSFFDIGGNSILLIKLYNQIEVVYPGVFNVAELFKISTIQKAAEHIKRFYDYSNAKSCFKPTELRPEYFLEIPEGFREENFEFEIQSDVLYEIDSISNEKSIDTKDILLSLFIYTLSKAAVNSEISLQLMVDKKQHISLLNMNLEEIETFSGLFDKVNEIRKSTCSKELFHIDIFKQEGVHQKDNSIHILYYNETMFDNSFDLSLCFDFILGVYEKGGKIRFSLKFNSSKLVETKVSQLIILFGELVEQLCNRDRRSIERG